jgi:hypothetical protein
VGLYHLKLDPQGVSIPYMYGLSCSTLAK